MSSVPVTFSASDLAASNQLEAGWYPLVIDSIVSGPGKSDPNSITWKIDLHVASGPFKDTPIKEFASSKMNARLVSLIKCFDKDPKPGKSYDLTQLIGKVVQGWVSFDDDGQFRNNKVKDFKPVGA